MIEGSLGRVFKPPVALELTLRMERPFADAVRDGHPAADRQPTSTLTRTATYNCANPLASAS